MKKQNKKSNLGQVSVGVENIKKFYALLGEDKKLMENVSKACEGLKNHFVAEEDFEKLELSEIYNLIKPFAENAGYPFTLADLKNYEKIENRKFTDEELAVASGGSCLCLVGGAGNDAGEGKRCACAIGGSGNEGKFWCAVIGTCGSTGQRNPIGPQ